MPHKFNADRRDTKQTLKSLMNLRYPIYEEADLIVLSRDVGKDIIVKEVLASIVEGKTAESKMR